MNKKLLVGFLSGIFLLISSLAVLLAVGSASATAFLSVDDGFGATRVISDGGPWDDSGVSGIVGYSDSLGVITNMNLVGISKNVTGSATSPRLDWSVFILGGPGNITVKFSDTDFTGSGIIPFSWLVGGITDGVVQWNAYYGVNNLPFEESGAIWNESLSDGTGGFGGLGQFDLGADPLLYSLTITARLTHDSGLYITEFDATSRAAQSPAVPEPTTMLLLGTGLVGVAGAARRRKKKNQA